MKHTCLVLLLVALSQPALAQQGYPYPRPPYGQAYAPYTPATPFIPNSGHSLQTRSYYGAYQGYPPPTMPQYYQPGYFYPSPQYSAPQTSFPPRPAVVAVIPHAPVETELVAAPAQPSYFDCRRKESAWFSADYVMAFARPGNLGIPLLTTGNVTDFIPGAIGQPGTVVLFGNNNLDFGMRNGFKLEAGVWVDEENRYSLDVGGFYLVPSVINFQASSDANGTPALFRPLFNVVTNREEAEVVAFPTDGVNPARAAGSTFIEASSFLVGGEINGRYNLPTHKSVSAQTLCGFRFLHMDESLIIRDSVQPLQNSFLTFQGAFVNPPNSLTDEDRFETANTFFGLQLGGRLRWRKDFFFVDVLGKVALGATQQRVNINGFSTLITPTGNTVAQGGILALPSNQGEHTRFVLGVVPEVGVNFGVDVLKHVRIRTGYSLLMWNKVVRPGDQIDRNVNPAQIPTDQSFGTLGGPTRPTFDFHNQFFWVHALNIGFEIHY